MTHLMAVLQHLLARSLVRIALVAAALAGLVVVTVADAPAATSATTTTTTPSTTTTTTTPPGPHSVPAYWLVASDGGIFAFGGMPFYGSMGGRPLAKPMVGMAPTADYKGYWTVASDGGIFSFGDAPFRGSVPGAIGHGPSYPIVGMAVDPATGGYWLVGSDGGLFSFGAPFFGSVPQYAKVTNVVAMAATPDGGGYWMVATDGGIFAFGDATFYGSLGGQPHVHPVAAMATADPGGYWMTDDNGAVTAFGDAGYFGSAPQQLGAPVVGMADGPGTGAAAGNAYQSGSYGYDISNFQCGAPFPSGHAIGIVETVGVPFGHLASCFNQEVQWAGAGLNLYIFLGYGTQAQAEPGCSSNACNYGYAAALDAFSKAQSAGADVNVTWWLDVEGPGQYWSSSDIAGNKAVIQGAVAALRGQGINNVGVYSTSYQWPQIVGSWQPQYPQWVAGATSAADAQSWCTETYRDNNQSNGTVSFDGGAVWLVQYQSNSNGTTFDGDYAC